MEGVVRVKNRYGTVAARVNQKGSQIEIAPRSPLTLYTNTFPALKPTTTTMSTTETEKPANDAEKPRSTAEADITKYKVRRVVL